VAALRRPPLSAGGIQFHQNRFDGGLQSPRMQWRVKSRRAEPSPTEWVDRFRTRGYRHSRFMAGWRASSSGWATASSRRSGRLSPRQGDVERLQVFYSELAQHDLPFATPEIHEISQIEGWVVSIERELPGTPLQRSSAEDDPDVAPEIVDCLVQVLQGLASVPGNGQLGGLPLLGETEAPWATCTNWGGPDPAASTPCGPIRSTTPGSRPQLRPQARDDPDPTRYGHAEVATRDPR
jgi:hypothetical protein